MLRLGILLLILTIGVALLVGAVDAAAPNQERQMGVFGTVLSISGDHPRAVSGETDVTLESASGTVELTATFDTIVRIPGREQPTLVDVAVGDSVAVLATDGRIVTLLVKPRQPVRVRHFTGVVTAVEESGTVSIRGANGRLISVMTLDEPSGLTLGDLVTAVLEQDLATGSLLATGLDRATDNLDRIQSAMEDAERSEAAAKLTAVRLRLAENSTRNLTLLQEVTGEWSKAAAKLAALRLRLAENSTRHLSLLQEVTAEAGPSIRPQLQASLELAKDTYATSLARFKAGRPTAQISGLVTSIDPTRRRVTVQPSTQPAVSLVVTDNTEINLRGSKIRFGQLDLAHRVVARYELDSQNASRITVVTETLGTEPAQALLAAEDPGMITGTIIDTDLSLYGESRITIRHAATQVTVSLVVPKQSAVLVEGRRSNLNRSLLGAKVNVIYDPDSLQSIELDTLPGDSGRKPLSGVVHGSNSKRGDLTVLTQEGLLRNFTRNNQTIIRRDGRQVSFTEIRLGDIVRPNTRYTENSTADATEQTPPVLVLLSLKSPPLVSIKGTIRGLTISPEGGIRVTVSTNMLDMVSLLVDDDTELRRRGKAVDASALAVGQRVADGAYDALSGRAARLHLVPSRIAQVNGEITEVDERRRTIAIATRNGETFRLTLTGRQAPVISRQGRRGLDFSDLRIGDRVRVALFDPVTNELLKLWVG